MPKRPKIRSTRHKWPAPGDERQYWTKDQVPFHYKTERDCLRCGLTRVTCHEMAGTSETFRVEWWRDGDRIKSELTPMCDARLELVPA